MDRTIARMGKQWGGKKLLNFNPLLKGSQHETLLLSALTREGMERNPDNNSCKPQPKRHPFIISSEGITKC